jgi:hypothetical protein
MTGASDASEQLREFAARQAAIWLDEHGLRTKIASAAERFMCEPFSPAARRALRDALDAAIQYDSEKAG